MGEVGRELMEVGDPGLVDLNEFVVEEGVTLCDVLFLVEKRKRDHSDSNWT